MKNKKASVVVRKAQKRDLDIVARILWEEVYDELDYQHIRQWIKESGWPYTHFNCWFVIIAHDKVVGTICWNVFDQYGDTVILNVAWIAISSAFQNKGYGTLLWYASLKEISKQMRDSGRRIGLIFVQVDEENEKARGFFRKILDNPIEIRLKNVWKKDSGIIFFFKCCLPI